MAFAPDHLIGIDHFTSGAAQIAELEVENSVRIFCEVVRREATINDFANGMCGRRADCLSVRKRNGFVLLRLGEFLRRRQSRAHHPF
jgi:hypothetical protein